MITSLRRRQSEQTFLLFPEKFHIGSLLELIISLKSSVNPLSTSLLMTSSFYIDCIFSSRCLYFSHFCCIQSLILVRSMFEKGDFDLAGKGCFSCFWQFRLIFIKLYFNQCWHRICGEFSIKEVKCTTQQIKLWNGIFVKFSILSESAKFKFEGRCLHSFVSVPVEKMKDSRIPKISVMRGCIVETLC